MTRYGRSPWIDQFPPSRVPSYPVLRDRIDTEVVVVGGGLTGCATAYAFAAAGIRVALVEAGRIGRGNSGGSAGWLADDPGASFVEVENALGLRAARHAWQAWRRAALDFAALLRRLRVKCHLEPGRALLAATTPEQATRLKREHRARRGASLEAAWLNARAATKEAALPAIAAVGSRDGGTLDPYRAALGLAAAAAARGAAIFEKTPVRRTTFGRRLAEIQTARGAIRAARVVVATGLPTSLVGQLMRHVWFRSSYLAITEPVPARIRKQLAPASIVLRDLALPPHVVRWVDGERLLVAGADGEQVAERRRDTTIVQRTGQLMYELSTLYPEISGLQPAYGWESAYARTADGLPYIGPHRNYPHHLFAFGGAGHSVTGAYLASRILLRHHLGQAERGDEAFGFNR
jgi:glycine/D-amino acid oxidase-like deaminating enzyme